METLSNQIAKGFNLQCQPYRLVALGWEATTGLSGKQSPSISDVCHMHHMPYFCQSHPRRWTYYRADMEKIREDFLTMP